MYQIERSALFVAHSLAFVKDYRERAGTETARKFVSGIGSSISFIAKNPLACAVYTRIGGYEYRKWSVKGFPHSIYFRIQRDTVILEAIYAHRMDALRRLSSAVGEGSEF